MTAAEGTSSDSETSGASTPSSDVTASAAEVVTEVPQPSTSSTDIPSATSQYPVAAQQQDPFDWPSILSDADRTDIVRRGPFQVAPAFTFPRRQDGRRFHHHYIYRTLINEETIKRSWLVYSRKNNAVYCFCCKLFSSKTYKLVKEGPSDWMNIGALLKPHENNPDHTKHMVTWKELELRLKKGKTIDQVEMSLIEASQKRWREVLNHLVAIIQSLAETNLALRGTVDTLYSQNNGKFLKEVELLARFDPVMRQHVSQVESGMNSHATNSGKTIQNELITCISDKMMERMVAEIKLSKYYAIILDCIPHLSHLEQMSVVIRTVKLEETPEIKEHFLGFVVAPESTGLGLSDLILSSLEELNIPFSDCRGQSYDNGGNMKGKNKGVQARLLVKNPRALYVPCVAHSLNLVVADAAKNSIDATSFFGNVYKIYTLFSAAPQRWAILKRHVTITASGIRDALLEVREKATDAITKIEAQSLAEEVGSFRFQICTVVWHDVLSKINTVSKLLQSSAMQLDVAVNLLESTKSHLLSYRNDGFAAAQASAKDAYEPVSDALKRLETTFFNVVVDSAIASLDDRFETLGQVKSKFGVLPNFPTLDDGALEKQCEELENTLRSGEEADIDGRELAMEIRNLPQLPTNRMTAFELLDFVHKKELTELYPNLWISLWIACTLPVTVALAERSFSKLKLIKTYLRSSMAQDRLTGLAILGINHEVGRQVSYDDVIHDFALRKSRSTSDRELVIIYIIHTVQYVQAAPRNDLGSLSTRRGVTHVSQYTSDQRNTQNACLF
uniref:zinc finger MYM-type protein 1-like n=1 Tax=Myxine glutinosa TaxID=7769 RepID=UPI00358EB2DD